jgi:hypothetical protein
LIVGYSLSNHTDDQLEVVPTLATVLAHPGWILAAALQTGYCSEANIKVLEAADIEPYIATDRAAHNRGWRAFFAEAGDAPSEEVSVWEKMFTRRRIA